MDDTYGMVKLDTSQKRAVLAELLNLLMPADQTTEAQQMSEEEKLKAAYALNLCTVSVSQIIDYNDIQFLEQEYEAILNNLNLEEMPKDEALLSILKQLLDVITYFRIQEGEKKLLEKEYQQKMKNAIWNAVPSIGLIVAGGNPVNMAISLASQIGIGYMNYRKEKAKIGLEQERKEWELQRSAMEQFNGLRRELFDTAWRLAEKYQFKDEYRLTERQITQFNRILMDADDQRRYERLLYIQNSFAAYPPFWYYLGSAANAVYQNADEYGYEISSDYKGYAKDAFGKFLNITKRNILREDQLEASCALELFDLLEVGEKEEKLQLLERAKKASGNAFDVLELCAISYLKIGETEKAADLFQMLVNEDYNTKVNAQLLSKIYVCQAIGESSDESRKRYQILQTRVGADSLFPMPTVDVNDGLMEWRFLAAQKNQLREKYVSILTEFIQKYSEKYDALLRLDGNISKEMLVLLEGMCKSVKMIAPERVFGYYIQTAVSEHQKDFQEMMISPDSRGQQKSKITFRMVTNEAFDNLAKYIGNRIDDMESMSGISEAEIDIERFCTENNLSKSETTHTKALEISGTKNVLAQILFDEKFKMQQTLAQKSEECTKLIADIIARKPLIGNSKKDTLCFYVRGDHYFDTYLKKNEKTLLKSGFRSLTSIIAVINDRSIRDMDLILNTENIMLFVKKKNRGIISYIDAAQCYVNNSLLFGGNIYTHDGVNMSILREITDALASIQTKYQKQMDSDITDMIVVVKNSIIGDSYHREYSTPPKPSYLVQPKLKNSLLEALHKDRLTNQSVATCSDAAQKE